jgi:N-acetylglucosaminyldiphosphoundecaprenol N-acetyl-beta-D-mannosaminyltransferase
MIDKLHIISLSVHHIGFNESLDKVIEWVKDKQPAYVCFANVHMTMEAKKYNSFLTQIENADLVLADGKPLAIACKLLHNKKQERICGIDFMSQLLERLNKTKTPVFLYGSSAETLERLKQKINNRYPDLILAGSVSPSFGPINDDEAIRDIETINQSRARVIFISLGCPKQEKWMATYSQKINGVLLGVGAAFPVMAGIQKRAPAWMQNMALEWLYRLMQQPRYLFKRYFTTIIPFLFLLTGKWIKKKFR